MNLYIRYFDREALVYNAEEAINFLRSIQEIPITPELETEIREYASSDILYPRRYKVRPRIYFIIIKTAAKNMMEFKEKKAVHSNMEMNNTKRDMGNFPTNRLTDYHPGWYEGELYFKRVVLIPSTNKHEYKDTLFVARVKAESALDCYNRIVDYLRSTVDPRSQFPSAKGKNYKFKYLGLWK